MSLVLLLLLSLLSLPASESADSQEWASCSYAPEDGVCKLEEELDLQLLVGDTDAEDGNFSICQQALFRHCVSARSSSTPRASGCQWSFATRCIFAETLARLSPSLRGHVQALSHCYPYWISPGQGNKERLYKLHTGIRRISAFFEDLYQNIEVQRVEELQANSRSSLLKTVIVGAGPVGLLNAIEHYRQGVSVAVLEKRQNYTRDVWFDIYGRPFSIGLEKLKQWGYVHLDIEARRFQQEHRQVGVIAVRAQVLERFLAKIVGLLDIRLIYGHQFLALCANPHTTETADMVRYSAGRAIFLNCMYSGMLDDRKLDVGSDNALFWCSKTPNELAVHFSRDADHWREVEASFLFMDFDLLIGADGTSSRVRHFAHIPYIQQHSFILSGINITVPGLHQTTLIVNFKPISHGRLQDDNQCIEINRRVRQDYPGLAIDGVTSVWKRFYFSHCQMQILFTQDYGNKIIDAYFGSRDEYRNYQQKKSYDNMRLVFWKMNKVLAMYCSKRRREEEKKWMKERACPGKS